MRGKMREDLLRGAPWEDEESRRRYFTMAALANFLERERLRNVNRRDIATWIRSLGGDLQGLTIKNNRKRFWWVPSDAVEEAPELDVPTMPDPAI